MSNPDLPWDYFGVSKNENITLNYVLSHLQKTWDWNELTYNSSISIKDIENI